MRKVRPKPTEGGFTNGQDSSAKDEQGQSDGNPLPPHTDKTASVFTQPESIADIEWSLSTLREKLVKIGAKVVAHGRYVTFQLAEVAVPRDLFREILRLIDDLRPSPTPA